eukprot:TRINITY_DN2878_c0_g1::TRINITY_DN2878_c0_g1_i1::g.5617::m.5617 TRINITY_DN2878_c0_g1::TRINITY_DN2878_c0_g1_i1::g.5617  ORF type:complete len:253 (-),score=20.98,Retrotrans_gag/PF03732.12/3.6e+02,Retrotrans_gag/PF03732.12/0.00022,DUF2458/PF10454.4/29,DUF2458/PF10454.4/1.2,Sigma70_ner/PF04546.8/20,Sigma70_ner/PF04546.8/15,PFEMP/PF03011.10/4.3,PFEMP/PF03011.10/37 TRINITY_DN2878_c0_g1_i1:4-762(-)
MAKKNKTRNKIITDDDTTPDDTTHQQSSDHDNNNDNDNDDDNARTTMNPLLDKLLQSLSLIEIPKYDGKGSARLFISRFEMAMAQRNIDQQSMSMFLTSSLIGPAAKWLETAYDGIECLDYKEVKQSLISQFSIKKNHLKVLDELLRSKQQASENTGTYANRIRAIMKQSECKFSEDESVQHLLNGMNERLLTIMGSQTFDLSWSQLIDLAEKVERKFPPLNATNTSTLTSSLPLPSSTSFPSSTPSPCTLR